MKKKKSKKRKSTFPFGLFLDQYPTHSRYAEAFRTLRTNIDFSFTEKEYRSILITSAGEEEGKTVTAANLAFTMSQMGKSVLILDADLRKPMLSRLTHSEDSIGVTGLLSDVFSHDLKEGAIGPFGVSDLYRLFSLQKKTGRLHLENGKEKVALFFLNGRLVDVHWLTRPGERKLASLLTKSGLITREQAEQAIARQKTTGQPLGFILINMGLVGEDNLAGPLNIHMMEGLRTALDFKAGTFSFKDLPASDYDGASFDPVDFERIYTQVTFGEEELPYLLQRMESAVLETDVRNLFLLPTGNLPPNPGELLASERMSFLLSNLKKRFDFLVIDSPPILPASDALVLAPHTDGVVMMIKAGLMNRKLIRKAVEQLDLAQANLIGVVLNEVDTKKDGYYKYYYKYYSKYYGDHD